MINFLILSKYCAWLYHTKMISKVEEWENKRGGGNMGNSQDTFPEINILDDYVVLHSVMAALFMYANFKSWGLSNK